jgi:tetratricopeptide (TPR) repeat protein
MPSAPKALNTVSPVIAYARLLLEMHRLIDDGQGDSDEAEALADRMDAPWHAMTGLEQGRMRGLAADLNALREGGPRRLEMSPEQLAEWKRSMREVFNPADVGDSDAALDALRRPIPSTLPGPVIPFLQARCWERLGYLETALVFMKEADRHDPDQAVSVLLLLLQLGRTAEVREYANRVITSTTIPLERYVAAVALLSVTRGLRTSEAAPILRQVASELRRALSEYLALSAAERAESAHADSHIAQALGLCLERLGDLKSALSVYSEAIERHPVAGEVFTARGIAQYETDRPKALADLKIAAQLRVPSIWPYLLLARHAIESGAPGTALKLARIAENQPGPPSARAEVYATIGMALADLGQPQEWVLESFDRAVALDPNNVGIQENRAIAKSLAPRSKGGRIQRRPLLQAPPVNLEDLRDVRSDEIGNRLEFFNEQRQTQIGQ